MDGEAITGLSAISNKSHPLYAYFDRGFHLQCFENWDRKQEAQNLIEEEKRKLKNTDCYKEMVLKHGISKWLDE